MTTSEVRARILEFARRRQKPGTGSSQEFLRRRTAMKHWPDLTGALGQIQWATAGGVATRHYAPERASVDLAGNGALDAVRDVVRQFDPDALEDVESMIVLGRMEMQP